MKDIEATPGLDLSLYNLETGLAELIEYRQSRLMDSETPPTEEEIAALDAEIQRYEIATPKKITGVVGVLRSWKSKRDTAKAEIARLYAIITHLETMEDRLKSYCAEVLERLPEPKKGLSKKLVGVDGSTLSLRTNGGLQPLEITDAEAIPDEYCRMEGWVRADLWELALDLVRSQRGPSRGTKINDYHVERVPDNAAIREALAQPCPTCQGRGARMSLMVVDVQCETCGGTGKNAIPGARLLDRGQSVIVK